MNSGFFFFKGQVEFPKKISWEGGQLLKKKKTPYPAVQNALALEARKNPPTSPAEALPQRFYLKFAV